MAKRVVLVIGMSLAAACAVQAERFELMTGVDARHWPGQSRSVSPVPGPGYDGTFYDGDRLAGTSDVGPIADYQGSGSPIIQPNAYGSLSMIFKRGSVPVFGQLPWMGIDFLGGPLVDLDGDPDNATRSLVPVAIEDPVLMPDTISYIDLEVDIAGGEVTLEGFDATSCSEGSQGIAAEAALALNFIAGTELDGSQTGPINPGIDTRVGGLIPFVGNSGTLTGVYRVQGLGYEIWQDTALENSSTAHLLGTFQFMGTLDGWLIRRDASTGDFPVLAGEGLGSTPWPMVNTSGIGLVFDTAPGMSPMTATIGEGEADDLFSVAGNGGLAMTDFGGDMGAYLDAVVVPLIDERSDRFVYLESLGYGINNSGDPIFYDSIGYDMVLIAAQVPSVDGDYDRDGDVDLADYAELSVCYTGDGAGSSPVDCEVFDFDFDSDVDLQDLAQWVGLLTGPGAPGL